MAEPRVGMSRTELERHVRWMLRRPPEDPARLLALLADVLVDLVDTNNAAIAARLATDAEAHDAGAY